MGRCGDLLILQPPKISFYIEVSLLKLPLIFFNVYLRVKEHVHVCARVRAHTHTHTHTRERGRERGEREFQAGYVLSAKNHDKGLNHMNHKIMTWAEAKHHTLNPLSHPSTLSCHLWIWSDPSLSLVSPIPLCIGGGGDFEFTRDEFSSQHCEPIT